jgi:hypothetical protein
MIKIADCTLRDGEKQGVSFSTKEDKIAMAKQLINLAYMESPLSLKGQEFSRAHKCVLIYIGANTIIAVITVARRSFISSSGG